MTALSVIYRTKELESVMEYGSIIVGETYTGEYGNIFMHTYGGWVSLSQPDHTWEAHKHPGDFMKYWKLLSPGSQITITIEEETSNAKR